MLRSSRGGFDIDKILKFILDNDIRQLYVIGGDGTHRGAFRIHEECIKKVKIGFTCIITLFFLILII